MPKPLDAATKKQLADRVNYYREMGIYDFYRRTGEGIVEESGEASVAEAPMAAGSSKPIVPKPPEEIKLLGLS